MAANAKHNSAGVPNTMGATAGGAAAVEGVAATTEVATVAEGSPAAAEVAATAARVANWASGRDSGPAPYPRSSPPSSGWVTKSSGLQCGS